MDTLAADISVWISENKTIFTIIFWSIATVGIVFAYLMFKKFRDFIINYGKKTARHYIEKVDPDLEEMDGQ